MMDVLENVARGKQASQSSHSAWSRPGEANNALNYDGRRDFSFHTDAGPELPWWMVDLGDQYPIHSIVVGNRRGYEFNARTLTVEVSRDGKAWDLVHGGMIVWKDDHAFHLGNEILARFVKLSLKENVYLHLTKVEVWSRRSPLKVIANRSDGFGCRLEALLQAAYYAKALNCGYAVRWSDEAAGAAGRFSGDQQMGGNAVLGHSVEPAAEIFTPAFVADKVEEGRRSIDTKLSEGRELTWAELQKARYQNEPGILWAPGGWIGNLLADTLAPNAAFGLPDIFETLPFSPQITLAIEAARDVGLNQKKAAVHIRSGDIVFGEYRKQGQRYMRKAVSLPLAKMAIEECERNGFLTVVFGEDLTSLALLKKQFPSILLAVELNGDRFRGAAGALFDIVLMSRMDRILAGGSGFARIAEDISRTAALHKVHDAFPEHLQQEYLKQDLERYGDTYHPMQKAFALWTLYVMSAAEMDLAGKTSLLDQLSGLDRENPVYPIVKGFALLDAGDEAGAEASFAALLTEGWQEGQAWGGTEVSQVLRAKRGDKFHLRHFYKGLVSYRGNQPHILYVKAMLADALGNKAEASRLLKRAGETSVSPTVAAAMPTERVE